MKDTQRMNRLLYFGIRIFRFITRLKSVTRAPGDNQYKLIGWQYVYFIGAWPDAVDEKGKEVL